MRSSMLWPHHRKQAMMGCVDSVAMMLRLCCLCRCCLGDLLSCASLQDCCGGALRPSARSVSGICERRSCTEVYTLWCTALCVHLSSKLWLVQACHSMLTANSLLLQESGLP